ncbi:hypothetical protein GCM10011390_19400 [Aureimonas endophytica]|uniref:Chitooligosaccharide deacetylase n=1 Tax=Aureimonas endophytica TaxID=2027858 RepID=A0A916ZJ39_9HYPH|nr:polysaccharide deacetylase family protein [Aureimonas endophytica]GGE00702.1 hypothetical protein GCM10011390_19400 [Aureimonas endophytica]
MQPISKIARTLFAFLSRPVEASPKGGGRRRWIVVALAPVVLAVPFALFLAVDPAPSGNIVTLTIGGDDLSAIACPPSEAVVPVDTGTLSTIGGDLPTDFRLGPNEYALTFDDGPMPWTTPHIAHILKSRCVPATFFMLGISARLFPMIVGTIRSGGFTIGSHTYWHKSLPELPIDKAKAEVLSGMEAVEAAAGGADGGGRLFRFPRWEARRSCATTSMASAPRPSSPTSRRRTGAASRRRKASRASGSGSTRPIAASSSCTTCSAIRWNSCRWSSTR